MHVGRECGARLEGRKDFGGDSEEGARSGRASQGTASAFSLKWKNRLSTETTWARSRRMVTVGRDSYW